MATFLDTAVSGAAGLQGLKSNQMQMDAYKQQQADTTEASNALRDYYKTGNQESLINATMKSPQLAQQVLAASGLDDQRKQQLAAADMAQLWQVKDDPQAFESVIAKRIDSIMQRGGNAADTIKLGQMYRENPEQAKQVMRSVGAGLEAQGFKTGIFADQADGQTPSSIKELEYYEKLKERNPEAAAKFAKAKGYVDTPKEQALTPQERNIAKYQEMVTAGNPNAEAFGRSAGILSKEGQVLSATTEKALIDSTNAAEQSRINTTKYLDLSDRVKASGASGGLFGSGGTWREGMKAAFGMQDEEISKNYSDWQKIRSSEAIKSLPQGPATDADIRLALRPLPESPNSEYLASYLKGLAKIAAYEEQYNQFKSDFITENGSIRGKGTNFDNEWKKRRPDILKQIGSDDRFKPKRLTVEEFTAEEQVKTPQGNVVGRFTVEVEQ
jgi:hypothetical protein